MQNYDNVKIEMQIVKIEMQIITKTVMIMILDNPTWAPARNRVL